MSYQITRYTYQRARMIGVTVKPSTVKGKKIDVYKNDKKVASIGDINYNDYGTYLETKGKQYANERRRLYKIRHKGENNWSLKILW